MIGLQGFTSPLWPVRYKPLDDELLSCWLVRLAHGHGLKVQTFCNLIFGNQRQVWNRDIDRLAPAWLIDALIAHTGTSEGIARETSLRIFDGVLYQRYRSTGHVAWIQNLQVYHRTRAGFGQQYCPACLASDAVPYFRKTWRLALKTFCLEHNCRLLDRCWSCDAGVSFHRMNMGNAGMFDDAPLSACFACRCDLTLAPRLRPQIYEEQAYGFVREIVEQLDRFSRGMGSAPRPDILAVLRHLTALMLSMRRKVHLREYMADKMDAIDPVVNLKGRPPIESQANEVRHALIQWAAWLLCDPAPRLREACDAGALLYNHLLRDFEAPPDWYVSAVSEPSASKRPRSNTGRWAIPEA